MQAIPRLANWRRSSWLRRILPVCFFAAPPSSGVFAQGLPDSSLIGQAVPFLKEHCFRCHGAEKQKGDRRFDILGTDLGAEDTLAGWQDILDILNLGEMPPPEEEERPGDAAVAQVVAVLTKVIAEAHVFARTDADTPVLRRMNRREYRNTIRDLLGRNNSLVDPTQGFPEDKEVDGFDNFGAVLTTSGHLLGYYLAAADRMMEESIDFGPRPELRRWTFAPPFDRTTRSHTGWVPQEAQNTTEFQSIFQGTKERHGYRPLDELADGVPHSGYYRIRINACGLHRNHRYPAALIPTDKDEPIRLAVVSGSREQGPLQLRQPNERTLAVFDLPDDHPGWVEATIWLDRGYLPRMTYENGPYSFKPLVEPIHRLHPEVFPAELTKIFEDAPPTMRDGVALPVKSFLQSMNGKHWWEICQSMQTPQIRIFGVELEGPILEQWPPSSHRIIFGDKPFTPERIEEIIEAFATRSFRRPVKQSELRGLVGVARHQRAAGASAVDALKVALQATLCSPTFLYIDSGEAQNDPVARNYRLASCLSYFLWSTMPDERLLGLAAAGRLTEPSVLLGEARRMLQDARVGAFVADFTDRWLRLYKLGKMPPDSRKFQIYYTGNLEQAMRRETQLFFNELLQSNGDIGNFIQASFTYVNRPLARHYGLDTSAFPRSQGLAGEGFQRVVLPPGARGGLLAQASVLTVTANGIDTSPVIRGVWVLENILGTPPNPPPPDVEPLEPDIRGAETIREQLVKHRKVATCASCHSKIDPIGFALEEFDAIGKVRRHYDARGRQLVDTTGIMPDGTHFDDLSGLREILLRRKGGQIAHNLVEKLLSYGLGRHLTIRDRPEVDAIVRDVSERGYGLRDFVLATVLSEAFRGTVHRDAQEEASPLLD